MRFPAEVAETLTTGTWIDAGALELGFTLKLVALLRKCCRHGLTPVSQPMHKGPVRAHHAFLSQSGVPLPTKNPWGPSAGGSRRPHKHSDYSVSYGAARATPGFSKRPACPVSSRWRICEESADVVGRGWNWYAPCGWLSMSHRMGLVRRFLILWFAAELAGADGLVLYSADSFAPSPGSLMVRCVEYHASVTTARHGVELCFNHGNAFGRRISGPAASRRRRGKGIRGGRLRPARHPNRDRRRRRHQ